MSRNKCFHCKCIYILLFLSASEAAFAHKAYVTDPIGGHVYAVTNDVAHTLTLGTNIPSFAQPNSVAISRDGKQAYVTDLGVGDIYVINTQTDVVTTITNNTSIPFVGCSSLACSPTQGKVYIGGQITSSIGVIYVVDTQSNITSKVIAMPTHMPIFESINAITFSDDGIKAYAVDEQNHMVYVIDTSSDAVSLVIDQNIQMPTSLSVNPTNRVQAYITDASSENPAIYVMNTTSNAITGSVTLQGNLQLNYPLTAAFSADGMFAYVTDKSSNVYIVQVSQQIASAAVAVGSSVPPFTRPQKIVFSPDGKVAYMTDLSKRYVYKINPKTQMAIGIIRLSKARSTQGIAFLPAPMPPQNPRGNQICNDYGLFYKLINSLQWDQSPSNISCYNIYLNDQLIGSTAELSFQHHQASKATSLNYTVTAVDITGVEGKPVSIAIR